MQNLNLDQYPDLVEAAAKDCIKRIQEEIDWSIICDMLESLGWHAIEFEPQMPDAEGHEIKEWLNNNCKGKVESRFDKFVFEKESDAVNFVLRWK